MDTRPTKSVFLPIPSRDALPRPANSDANVRCVKVKPPLQYITIILCLSNSCICLGLSTKTNTCFPNQLQVPKPPRSTEAMETERYYGMCRNSRQSTPSYSNSICFNLGGRQNANCVMVGFASNQGYSRGPDIFRNIAAMRAKETAAKEKDGIFKPK